MARVTPISGFPEWSPAQRIVEQRMLDELRTVFELHGFAGIETRAVETLEQLLRKGEIDKEVYGVRRLAADPDAAADPSRDLALHFDLTVPFARYVVENAGKLEFPFRRYQIQKVWRGERPQEGRYREFTQVDIDVVDRDRLDFHYEVEMPLVMAEAFGRLRPLGLPEMTIRVNNRKLAEGFYRGLGAEDPAAVLRAVDKLDKVGADAVLAELERSGLPAEAARKCLQLAQIRSDDDSFIGEVQALGVRSDLLDEGLDELGQVVRAARASAPGQLVADLSIARGLDYYTGTVYETTMHGLESYGSACSGGRYDALATDARATYPGVGISFGLTRVLGLLFARGLTASRSVPTAVLVMLPDDESRDRCRRLAQVLRDRGISALVAPRPDKFGKQLRFADRRGIPFVLFPGEATAADGDITGVELKDLRTGEQGPVDLHRWHPPADDGVPRVIHPGVD
ncbi:MAG: histidine--tRNA ligase [Actinomycetales bacterium]